MKNTRAGISRVCATAHPAVPSGAALLLLLAGLVMTLCGCETVHERVELAPPPPALSLAPDKETIKTSMLDTDASHIEPAAGATETATVSDQPRVLARQCNLRIGAGSGEAFSYNWDNSRVGLGFGSSGQEDEFATSATVRYSISLHGGKSSSGACADSFF